MDLLLPLSSIPVLYLPVMKITYLLPHISFRLSFFDASGVSTLAFLMAFFLFTYPSITHAQTPTVGVSVSPGGGGIGGAVMEIKLFPKNPKANKPYIAELESFRVGFSNTPVVWIVNGEEIARGFNITRVRIIAPPVGETQTIQASATINGELFSVTRTVRSVELALRYEAHTYTPLFYMGIPLHTPNSRVTIVAFPQFPTTSGGQYNPKELIYNWRVNGKKVKEVGGRGANALAVHNSGVLRPMKVEVDVFSQNNLLSAYSAIEIPVRQPQVVVYEHHPLMGILYNRAITSKKLTETETSFVAEPFFFSLDTREDPNISYTWKVDGRELDISSSRLSLRHTPENKVQSSIEVNLRHGVSVLQQALTRFDVEYR